jgi:gluconokinase
MIEKIRLHATGELHEDYLPNLGKGFDHSCCLFLSINYEKFAAAVLTGLSDEALWSWIMQHGKIPSEEEITVWNAFMIKWGWRDEGIFLLARRLKEGGFEQRADIQTMFDYMDLDEGRLLRTPPYQ